MPTFHGRLTIGERVLDVDGQYELQVSPVNRLTGSFALPVKDATAAV
jgi:hypothetical protein